MKSVLCLATLGLTCAVKHQSPLGENTAQGPQPDAFIEMKMWDRGNVWATGAFVLPPAEVRAASPLGDGLVLRAGRMGANVNVGERDYIWDERGNKVENIYYLGLSYQRDFPQYETIFLGRPNEDDEPLSASHDGLAHFESGRGANAEPWYHAILAFRIQAECHEPSYLVCFGTREKRGIKHDYDCKYTNSEDLKMGEYTFGKHNVTIMENDGFCTSKQDGTEFARLYAKVVNRDDRDDYAKTCLVTKQCSENATSHYYIGFYNLDVDLHPTIDDGHFFVTTHVTVPSNATLPMLRRN